MREWKVEVMEILKMGERGGSESEATERGMQQREEKDGRRVGSEGRKEVGCERTGPRCGR